MNVNSRTDNFSLKKGISLGLDHSNWHPQRRFIALLVYDS
jgi:hypothetical protein